MTDIERGRHIDTALIICALAIIMSLCTMYTTHVQRVNAMETHDILLKTYNAISTDASERAQRRITIDNRLDRIDQNLKNSLDKISAQQELITKIKESEEGYHSRRPAAAKPATP